MKDDRIYIRHVLDCLVRIQRYCRQGKATHPEIDWRAISGFRNVLVHDYLGINLVRVWEIVSVHLLLLHSQLEAIGRETDSHC